MSENSSTPSKNNLLRAVVVLLLVFAGIQTWYMVNMKHKLDAVSAAHQETSTAIAQASNTGQKNQSIAKAPDKTISKPDPALSMNDDFFNAPPNSGKWNPYAEIERMQHQMDSIFNNAYSHFNTSGDFNDMFKDTVSVPQMDVQEDSSKYTVTVDIPGASDKNISVNLDGQQLTITGQQDYDQQKKDSDGNVILQERHSGKFERSITLPEPVKQNSMVSHVDNGVLTITVPKVG
jgi:HSP20 family protein